MAIFGRKRVTDPADELDRAFRAEHVENMVTEEFRAEMLRNWVDVHAECGVSARDFLRIALRRPTKVDPRVVGSAAERVARHRGIEPPTGKWPHDDIVSHHLKIREAIAGGATGERVEELMEGIPSYPSNTAIHIMLILQDLGRVTAQRGHLLQTGVGATDPMLGAARELIDLASRQRWDEAKRAVLDLCDPVPEAPDETGQPGVAMQGLLLGLLYREFGSGA